MISILSGCCGALALVLDEENIGRCSECFEMAEFVEVDEEDYL